MTDVHIVDALIRETGRHLLSFLFNIQDEGKKAFNARRGDIVAIRALDQRFSFQVQNSNEARHYAVG